MIDVLNTETVAIAANIVGVGLACVAIFGLHHRTWKRIDARRQPYEDMLEDGFRKLLRRRPTLSYLPPRIVAPTSVH